MSSKQKLTVIVLMTVFSWSVVMAALGQLAAVATLVPSLGLLVQQLVQVFGGGDSSRSADVASPRARHDEERTQ
ncbi:hypothetical protein [Streptomyces sp. H39-C1]|uniref:hypothetical protein n=1 Tax=Streptomyces sp. H39-C1 TaxID=3004355 RepID=UPI0022AF2213|nr:hypothetical protein [Streptomyces sp. H39-C1]MCZ4101082.1 hypothetical protein [Streptomyces sp. H39-C1]